MSRHSKLTKEARLDIITRRLNGEALKTIVQAHGVNERTVRYLVQRYRAKGATYILERVSNQKYTEQFKNEVIQEYLAGKGSSSNLAIKYGIPSRCTVTKWVTEYNNGHRDMRKTSLGGSVHMTKGRKTTLEERGKIVAHCLANDCDYILTSQEFGVSYNQIYSWVRKYKERGLAGLKDTRGKGKAIEDMTELERLKLENKLLEAKNYRLQMENDLIKKVREIERGYGSTLSGSKDSTKR